MKHAHIYLQAYWKSRAGPMGRDGLGLLGHSLNQGRRGIKSIIGSANIWQCKVAVQECSMLSATADQSPLGGTMLE